MIVNLTENLNVTHYRNGDEIPHVTDPVEWAGLTTGAWCHYDNNPANEEKYGKLYNWYAVNDPRGLAPHGYHVPSDEEWDSIEPDCLPGGYRTNDGSFTNIGNNGNWWSSTEYNTTYAWFRYLNYNISNVNRNSFDKRLGFSVRCVRDVELTEPLETKLTNMKETLEEAAEIWVNNRFIKQRIDEDIYASKSSIIESHIIFAKWQQERMYSEEEVFEILCKSHNAERASIIANTLKKWFEQLKTK